MGVIMNKLFQDLYKHNQVAVKKGVQDLLTYGKTCIVQVPNTGKTYVGLGIKEILQKRTVIVTATNDIAFQTKQVIEEYQIKDVQVVTYDKLIRMSEKELRDLNPELLILDEAHHCEAPIYKKPIDYLEQIFPNMLLLGLTATPQRASDYVRKVDANGNIIKERKNVIETRFEGHVAYKYSLEEALEDELIVPFTYVQAYFVLETTIKEYEAKARRRYQGAIPKDIQEKLKRLAGYHVNLEKVLKKYIKEGKVLVYCRNIKELKKMKKHFQEMYKEARILEYHSQQSKKENERVFEEIKKTNTRITFFFVVNKFSEGVHFPREISFDSGIFLKPTKSYRVALQELGRLLGKKNVLLLDLVGRIEETGLEKLYFQVKEYIKRNPSLQEKIDINEFQMIEEGREVKEILEALDKRLYLSFLERLEYIYEIVKKNPKIGITLIKERFPDGKVIGIWWARHIPKYIQKMKNTKEEDMTEMDRKALWILAKIDEVQGNTLDFVGKLTYIYKIVEKNPKIGISNIKERFPDGTVIGNWWSNNIPEYIEKMKNASEEEMTEENRQALWLLAKIDEVQGNILDFVGKLIYIYKIVNENPKIGITLIKERFPDGKVIGIWWARHIPKYIQKMKNTKEEDMTEMDRKALWILAKIDEVQGNTLDFVGKLTYIYKIVEKNPKIGITNIKERFSDGTVIFTWWNRNIPEYIKKMKNTPKEKLTEENRQALWLLAKIDEIQGNTLYFVGRLTYIYKLVQENPKIGISNIKERFPDGTVIGNWWSNNIPEYIEKMKNTKEEAMTEKDRQVLWLLAKIDEVQGNTLDFVGRLTYIYKLVQENPTIAITQIKNRFPDGTIIGKWWTNNVPQYIKTMKNTKEEDMTEMDRQALWILAKIDETQGNTLDFVGRLTYIYKLVPENPKITISQMKERFPDGKVIGNWWNYNIPKYIEKMKSTSEESMTEEDRKTLWILAKIDEIQGNILDFVGKLTYIYKIVKKNPKIGITKIKERFPDGTIPGEWWRYNVLKYIEKMQNIKEEDMTEEDYRRLKIILEIYKLQNKECKVEFLLQLRKI